MPSWRSASLWERNVVAVFTKKGDEDRQLAAARRDLDAARQKLDAILARQDAAEASADKWDQWTVARDAAASDVARLTSLVGRLEAAAEAARAHDQAEATRKRLAAARKSADDLAKRIRDDGARIATELLQLAKDAAAQSLEAKRLNQNLPEGEAPVRAADILARDAGAAPREDLRSREVELWVIAGTGDIVGNQSAVASTDGITGQLDAPFSSMRPRCLKRRFREIEHHPAEFLDWPGDLFSLVKLPHFAGPGLLFDGSTTIIEQVAALDVDAIGMPVKKPKRPTQIKLIPVDPAWPPADALAGEADRATL
jgi:hypothetical protein